jgi:Rad3-related DNA helicase
LSPPAYFLRVFGCGESTKRLVIGSPFPPENTGVFLFDRVSTYFVRRRETAPQIAGILSALALSGPGNYLLFFPSYAYMQMIYDSFRVKHPQVDTILQTPEMDEHQRDAFLKRFAVENRDTLMGFAVMGGVFGEGIDLVGERLSGAVIVGVGLPGISLERDLIRRHFEENLAAGFEFAYMYPGVNRVLQAAGRVIRSERDRGVVLLLDRRFAAMRYRALMPREWQPKIVRNEAQLADCLHRFWEGTAERSGSKL